MSADTADQHRRLADLIDRVDGEGVENIDVETDFAYSGELRATISLEIPEPPEESDPDQPRCARCGTVLGEEWLERTKGEGGPAPCPMCERNPLPPIGKAVVDELESGHENAVDEMVACDADHSNLAGGSECPDCPYVAPLPGAESDEAENDAPADASATPETADQEDVDVPAESDVAPADVDAEGEQDGTEDEPDGPDPDGVPGEVLAALREEGELSASDLETITGVGSVYTALSKLDEDDLIEKRDDPQDARRTLYRAADWLVDAGDDDDSDPETVLAESSVPDRVGLSETLDAVAASNTVYDAAKTLDIPPQDLEEFCQRLDLKEGENRLLVTDVEERVDALREEVADGE